jgi:hypothetical protein
MARKRSSSGSRKPRKLKDGEAFVGRTDKHGEVHWQPVKLEWQQVRPPIRKPKRKAG